MPPTPSPPISSQVVHSVAILRGIGRDYTRPLDARESEALGVIYRAYSGMILGVLRHLLGDRAEAEDLLHDVFCRLPWKLSQYREQSFAGWLRQSAVYLALSRLRARRRETTVSDCAGVEFIPPVTELDFAALDYSDAAAQALAALSPTLREVVVMRVMLDLTHKEIAEALDISVTASEVRLCRALKQLRVALRDEYASRHCHLA